MAGIYSSSGKINTTTVTGSSYTGIQASDGSINIILDDATHTGALHPCGAARINSATGATYYDGSGASYSNRFLGVGTASAGSGFTPADTVLAADDFTASVTTNLSAITMRTGQTWLHHATWNGDLVITDQNRARHNAGTIAVYGVNIADTANCIVSSRLYFTDGWASVAGFQIGVVARADMVADTFYFFYYNGGNVILAKRVAGSFTTLDQFSVSNIQTQWWGNCKRGYIDIALVCNGTSIQGYVDGVQRCTATDSSIATGKVGVYGFTPTANATGGHIDCFAARTLINPLPTALGVLLTSPVNGNTATFGGVRGIRPNGASIAATVLPTDSSTPMQYQWYRSEVSTDLPSTPTLLTGQTTSTLDDRTGSANKIYYYRCAVKDAAGNLGYTDSHRIPTFNTTDKQVVFIGNSLTHGFGPGVTKEVNDYPTVCLTNLGSPWVGTNFGISSWTTPDLTMLGPYFFPYQYDSSFTKNIAVIWEGTNYLSAATAVAGLSAMASLIGYVKGLGYKVIVCNVIDRQSTGVPADMATRISDFNAGLLANYVSYGADAHIDLHALLPDSTNVTNFQADKVHLTVAGYAVVANAVSPIVSSL